MDASTYSVVTLAPLTADPWPAGSQPAVSGQAVSRQEARPLAETPEVPFRQEPQMAADRPAELRPEAERVVSQQEAS